MSAAFFVGKVVDVRGCCGVPGTGGRLGGELWGCLVVAVVTIGFTVRSWVRPRSVDLRWGGELLLLAESLSVPDLLADLDDFPEPDPAGRVLVLRSYP